MTKDTILTQLKTNLKKLLDYEIKFSVESTTGTKLDNGDIDTKISFKIVECNKPSLNGKSIEVEFTLDNTNSGWKITKKNLSNIKF